MISFAQLIEEIKGDLPKGRFFLITFINCYFFKPSFRILLNFRLGKYFFSRKNFLFKLIAKYYRYRLLTKRNCDISYNATIGKNFKMPHPLGIVIGDGVVIKDNVVVFQQVTFGSHGKKGGHFLYPVVENGVKIFPGSKILGGIVLGENSVIGANSVVNKDVPPGSTAVGIPCRIIN